MLTPFEKKWFDYVMFIYTHMMAMKDQRNGTDIPAILVTIGMKYINKKLIV